MRKFLGYSPPFNTFLIEMLNIGRNMILEKRKTTGASRERAESG